MINWLVIVWFVAVMYWAWQESKAEGEAEHSDEMNADEKTWKPLVEKEEKVVEKIAEKKSEVAVKKAAVVGVKKDNLKRVEGIGPKMEGVLRTVGIETFEDLGGKKVGELRKIIKEADIKVPMDPTTWPKQAKLAAKGDWKKLGELQKLKGGKVVKK